MSRLIDITCCYCSERIALDDDAQRVERSLYAHTACAIEVNDAFFLAQDEIDDNK